MASAETTQNPTVPAQEAGSSAGLCANCVSGYAIPGTPRGEAVTIGPYYTYVARPSSGAKSDKAVVYFLDALGLQLQNNKIIPDRIADALGVDVYVPDYFFGDGVAETALGDRPDTAADIRARTFLEKVSGTLKMVTLAPWLIKHRPGAKMADTQEFLKKLREERGVTKIGGVGYCYGGKFVIHFNGTGDLACSVACHPSFVDKNDIENIKNPISFVCADEDDLFNAKLREESRAQLEKKEGIVSEFKVYENTVHGFAARPNLAKPDIKAAFEGAFDQTISFFKQHLLADTTGTATVTATAAAPAPAPAA